jgi:hypothetical protein
MVNLKVVPVTYIEVCYYQCKTYFTADQISGLAATSVYFVAAALLWLAHRS